MAYRKPKPIKNGCIVCGCPRGKDTFLCDPCSAKLQRDCKGKGWATQINWVADQQAKRKKKPKAKK